MSEGVLQRRAVVVMGENAWVRVAGLYAVKAGERFRMFDPDGTAVDLGVRCLSEGPLYEVTAAKDGVLVSDGVKELGYVEFDCPFLGQIGLAGSW